MDSDGVNSVLMNCFELCVGLRLSLQVHLTEHVKSRFFTDAVGAGAGLAFNAPFQLPSALIPAQAERLTILQTNSLDCRWSSVGSRKYSRGRLQ